MWCVSLIFYRFCFQSNDLLRHHCRMQSPSGQGSDPTALLCSWEGCEACPTGDRNYEKQCWREPDSKSRLYYLSHVEWAENGCRTNHAKSQVSLSLWTISLEYGFPVFILASLCQAFNAISNFVLQFSYFNFLIHSASIGMTDESGTQVLVGGGIK